MYFAFHTIENLEIIKALLQKIALAIFALSSFCLRAQPLPEPILEYKLDNNYEDESLNGFDGAGFNGEFVDDYLGNPNSALSLNGTDTYVEFPDTPVLKPELPITIALRAKFDVMDQTQVLFTTDFAELHHSGVWVQVATENRLAAAFGTGVNGFNGPGRRGFFTDNAFTPNGDGLNDIFKVATDCPVETFHLLIFNRWGNLVFESKDIDYGWNGHSPNTDFYASHGVYFYIVKYTQRLDGLLLPKELTGRVTLLR